jgi:hypothetical protein
VLDLNSLDLEEIANALADQTDYEHRWLIDPHTGEITFWTADTGIDGQTPVDLDELDLVCIDPLPSWVWYQDMADFAEAITDERAGRRLGRAIQGKGAFRRFKDELHEEYRTCWQCGTPSGTPVPGAGPCNGWLITRSLTTTPRTASFPGTQIPPCPEPAGAVTSALSCRRPGNPPEPLAPRRTGRTAGQPPCVDAGPIARSRGHSARRASTTGCLAARCLQARRQT